MSHVSNKDDLFDSVVLVAQDAYQKGYEEGAEEGKRQAKVTGLKAGQNIAIQINSEFGYYFGICEAYNQKRIQTNDQRIISLASQICDLISKVDISNSQNEQLENELNRVRDKFKQFCSLTNVRNMLAREIPGENLTF